MLRQQALLGRPAKESLFGIGRLAERAHPDRSEIVSNAFELERLLGDPVDMAAHQRYRLVGAQEASAGMLHQARRQMHEAPNSDVVLALRAA